jgi:hypothetical protein
VSRPDTAVSLGRLAGCRGEEGLGGPSFGLQDLLATTAVHIAMQAFTVTFTFRTTPVVLAGVTAFQ